VRTMARVIADGNDSCAEELLGAFGVYGPVAGQDEEQLIDDQRQAELAGIDNWAEVARALNLKRYREVLAASSIEDLQRASGIVLSATALQSMIVMMGLWPTMASRNGSTETVPVNLCSVGPDVIARLTADPLWEQWGRHQMTMIPGATVIPLVMATLGLLMLPSMLTAVEAYHGRLQELVHELAVAVPGRGLS
jgi:hypothetical protein